MHLRKKRKIEPETDSSFLWMVSFSDVITLLLTFFVLIIAITSFEPKVYLEDLGSSVHKKGSGILGHKDGQPHEDLEFFLENLKIFSDDLVLNQEKIKQALFQLEANEVELNSPFYQDIIENKVLVEFTKQGLVLKWEGDVFFREGEAVLSNEANVLLKNLAKNLENINIGISIEAHTDPLSIIENKDNTGAYFLSYQRARAVMDYLLEQGLASGKFRLSAYGSSKALLVKPGDAFISGAKARRLEIVLFSL